MKYIDVERLKAEIERLRKLLPWGGSASQVAMECNCKNEAYDEILAFIDSLQEIEGTSSKSPIIPQDEESINSDKNEEKFIGSSDLEEAAEEYASSKHHDKMLQEIVADDFKAGAEWMKEQGDIVETEPYFCDSEGNAEVSVPTTYKPHEKVIVQIRKVE